MHVCECVFNSWKRPELHITSPVRGSKQPSTKRNKQTKTLRWVQRKRRNSQMPERRPRRRKKRWGGMFTHTHCFTPRTSCVLNKGFICNTFKFTITDSHHVIEYKHVAIQWNFVGLQHVVIFIQLRNYQLSSRHFPCMEMCYCYTAQCLWSPELKQWRAPDDLYILDHPPLKKHSRCSFLGSTKQLFIIKTVPVCCLQTREHYEKVLEDATSYTPRYMEEMEAIFEQSQEEERKRISFLKQAFLSIHRHLDITNNERWAATRWVD